jgi:hypothetical protein
MLKSLSGARNSKWAQHSTARALSRFNLEYRYTEMHKVSRLTHRHRVPIPSHLSSPSSPRVFRVFVVVVQA